MTEQNTAPQSLKARIDSLRRFQQLSWLLYQMPKVTIASVNGFAMGAGLGVCSRLRFADRLRATWLLTRYAGAPKAKELMFTGDSFDTSEALRMGLLNRVVPADSLARETCALAARLAPGPLVSYRYMKANVNLAATADFRTVLDREAETHLRCGRTEDHREGVRAFLEKRAPNFQGK